MILMTPDVDVIWFVGSVMLGVVPMVGCIRDTEENRDALSGAHVEILTEQQAKQMILTQDVQLSVASELLTPVTGEVH